MIKLKKCLTSWYMLRAYRAGNFLGEVVLLALTLKILQMHVNANENVSMHVGGRKIMV